MDNMRPLVISEHMAADNALNFRIESREEIGIAQQHPVEENNIKSFHTIEHDYEPEKEFQKSESISYAVPSA